MTAGMTLILFKHEQVIPSSAIGLHVEKILLYNVNKCMRFGGLETDHLLRPCSSSAVSCRWWWHKDPYCLQLHILITSKEKFIVNSI